MMLALSPSLVAILVLLTIAQRSALGAAGEPTSSPNGGAPEAPLEFYMHDILGGSSPTARPVTGLLGNIYNGLVPFATPLGFKIPKDGVVLPNSNGVIPTFSSQGIPLGTGLSGTGFAHGSNDQNPNVRTQVGPDGLGLGFGTITVIDDELTMGPELGSQPIGRAQGVYIASSVDGTTQMMQFTTLLEGGEFGDSLNLFGVYHIGLPMSRISVTGGTGKFKHASGFADIQPLVPTGQHGTDGAETLLKITIHLVY